MDLKKGLVYTVFTILLSCSTFAVSVVQTTVQENQDALNQGFGQFLLTVIVFSVVGILILTILFWVIFTFYKKFSSLFQRSKDFLYRQFERDVKHCFVNRDKGMIKRNWRFFWLFFKRETVYCDTSKGLKPIGLYQGEGFKKEGFYMVSLYNKIGLFKVMYSVVIIPLMIKDKLVKKITLGGKSVLVLDCEGLDSYASTEYYFIPLIKDDNGKFIDFADFVHKNYVEGVVHRDVITKNLLSYRKGVISSVESNPNVHFKRRSE